MISYTTIGVIVLIICVLRLGWLATTVIAVAVLSVPAVAQFSDAAKGVLGMFDHAVLGVSSGSAVGAILPALGWG